MKALVQIGNAGLNVGVKMSAAVSDSITDTLRARRAQLVLEAAVVDPEVIQ